MSLDFCRRQSRPMSVILKVNTQHLMWIYMSLGDNFYELVSLQASWGQWEHKTSDHLNKNHYQMDLLKSYTEQRAMCVATIGFHGN